MPRIHEKMGIPNTNQFFLVADDMFIIIPLP